MLQDATAVVPDHPYAHLLLGGLARERGDVDQARREFAYETASLEDLQRWMRLSYGPRPLTRLDLGDGLDLGNIEGWHAAADGMRWTTAHAQAWLARPTDGGTLRLRLAHGRPSDAVTGDNLPVRVSVDGRFIAVVEVGDPWQVYDVPLPEDMPSMDALMMISLDAPTFRPRSFDRANGDDRALGVMVDWIDTVNPTAQIVNEQLAGGPR